MHRAGRCGDVEPLRSTAENRTNSLRLISLKSLKPSGEACCGPVPVRSPSEPSAETESRP